MAEKIKDCWEQYSYEEFTLRKSLLKDHINLIRTENLALFEKVNSKNHLHTEYLNKPNIFQQLKMQVNFINLFTPIVQKILFLNTYVKLSKLITFNTTRLVFGVIFINLFTAIFQNFSLPF